MTDIEKEQIWIKRTKEQYPLVWKYYCDLIAAERMSRDELEDYNFRKSVETMRYAYENTVFYRRLYDQAGVHPNDVKTVADWEKLPIVTKEMVREFGEEMVVPDTDDWRKPIRTSGSTGQPLQFFEDKRWYELPPLEWRPRGWWVGRQCGAIESRNPVLGVNEATVERIHGNGRVSEEYWKRRIKDYYPMEVVRLDAQKMSELDIEVFAHEAKRIGIYHAYGYVGAMETLADWYQNGRMDLIFRPKTISVAASRLTETARRKIEGTFNCQVFNVYGANEIGRMAASCRKSNGALHVYTDLRRLDLIDEQGSAIHDESEGRTVLTSFHCAVMPFVRYKLGDYTHWVKSPCPCGLPFPRVAAIKGRETDYLTDKNGKRVFGLNASFDDYPNCVRAFQFVEHCPGRVTLLVVPNRDHPSYGEEIENIRRTWCENTQGGLDIVVEEVDDIPLDGGKIRFIVHQGEAK